MTGLTVIVVEPVSARLRAALTLACAASALGGQARVYLHEGAVALLDGRDDPDSIELIRHGLPDLPHLLAIARDSGVELIACQTGLALAGLEHDRLSSGFEAGGLVGLLAALQDDRLVVV